jgi:hypothetical protein
MRPGSTTAAAMLVALGLTACNNPDGERRAAGACTPFPEAASNNNSNGQAAAQLADPAAALDDCLHRWGYTLAPSRDAADAVAQASVAACTPLLTRWNRQGLSTGALPQPAVGDQEAPSLLTGQPTTPLAEHYTYAQARALFYVVQARAGKCAPPSSTTPPAAANPPAAGNPPPR